MSDRSTIEWTDATWSPVTGCTKVSPGCDNCYARAMALGRHRRFYPQGFGHVELRPDRLDQPLHWKRPRRIFVCAQSDLFHPRVPWEFVDKVFAVMALAKQHTFQILTKRPGRMAWYFTAETPLLPRENFPHARPVSRPTRIGWAAQGWAEDHGAQRNHAKPWEWQYPLPRRYEDIISSGGMDEWLEWPLPNVWAGVSIPNARYLPWLDVLRRVPALVRFVSLEPLLGPVDLSPWLPCATIGGVEFESWPSWVILGGESGPKARPMHPDWVRKVRDDCDAAGVPFFFKQWGEWGIRSPASMPEGARFQHVPLDGQPYVLGQTERPLWTMYRVGRRAAGALLDGKEYREWPQQMT